MSNSSYRPHSGQPEGAMMSASADDTTVHPKLSGRLDDPGRDLRTDPRLKPRLRAALAAFGLDAAAGPPPIDRTAAPEAIVEFVGESHAGFGGLYEALPNDLPGDDDSVEFSTDTVRGVDGNDITLQIYRSANVTGPLPCTVYIHGGGMTILDAFAKVHQRWCEDLAATGMVVIGVDFRNAYSAEGMHPFPAGLNDCTSALEWVCWLLGISDLKSGFSQNLKGEIDPVLPIYPLFTDRSLTLNQDGVCALTESASGTSTPSRAGFFPLGKQKEKTECPKASYSVSAPFGMGLREALHRFFALWQFQRNVHRITHQAMSTHAL